MTVRPLDRPDFIFGLHGPSVLVSINVTLIIRYHFYSYWFYFGSPQSVGFRFNKRSFSSTALKTESELLETFRTLGLGLAALQSCW